MSVSGTDIAALVAIAIVVAIIILTIYYYNSGWAPFTISNGDVFAIVAPAGYGVHQLRFKKCIFTVTLAGSTPKQFDVTNVLRGMALAWDPKADLPVDVGARMPLQGVLTMGAPEQVSTNPVTFATAPSQKLNPFSFTIPGFNDVKTVPNNQVAPWNSPATTVSLTGLYKVIGSPAAATS